MPISIGSGFQNKLQYKPQKGYFDSELVFRKNNATIGVPDKPLKNGIFERYDFS